MSRRDYLPEADALFNAWCGNFVAKVTADPARYGLDPDDAVALESALAAFAAAYKAAKEPATRTVVAVSDKNEARAALERVVRAAVHRVQSFPGTGPADRIALGISRRDPRATRIGPPSTRPVLFPAAVLRGHAPTLRISDDSNPCRTAFPPGVAAAIVFTCACPFGTNPPPEFDGWRFEGVATKAQFRLAHRPEDAGRRVYAMAVWVNPRGELGRRSVPLEISPGVALRAAA